MKKLLKILPLYLILYPFILFSQNSDSVIVEHDTLKIIVDTTTTKDVYKSEKSEIDSAESKGLLENIKPPKIDNLISIEKIFWAVVFLVIGYLIIKLISKILNTWAEKSTTQRITLKGIIPVVRIFGWSTIIYIVIAGIFAPPIENIIAITASIGIAVGFAAQDILKNIFGGIMILFDRPFQVGDKIEVGNHYGEVVKIGLRSTRIVTPDDSLVSIPNGEIMNQSVSNANAGEPNCQVVAEIYLPISIDTAKVREIAIRSAQVSRYIYLNKPIVVVFFNEVKQRKSMLLMRLKAYVLDIRYEFAFKSDLTELFLKELFAQKLINDKDFE